MDSKISSIVLDEFIACFPQFYEKATNLRERGYSELVFDMPNGNTYVYDQLMDSIFLENKQSEDNPRSKEEWRNEFSTRLKRHMKRLRWSQLDLAEALGVQQPTVWNWCQGNTLPSVDMAVKIAHILKVPVSEFLDFY